MSWSDNTQNFQQCRGGNRGRYVDDLVLQAMVPYSRGIAIGSPVSPAVFHWRTDTPCTSANCRYGHLTTEVASEEDLTTSRWLFFTLRILWIYKKWHRIVTLSLWNEVLGDRAYVTSLQWYEYRRLTIRTFLLQLGADRSTILTAIRYCGETGEFTWFRLIVESLGFLYGATPSEPPSAATASVSSHDECASEPECESSVRGHHNISEVD